MDALHICLIAAVIMLLGTVALLAIFLLRSQNALDFMFSERVMSLDGRLRKIERFQRGISEAASKACQSGERENESDWLEPGGTT